MPKSLDKGTRKRKKDSTNSTANIGSDSSESQLCPNKKKKAPKRRNCLDGIDMSKQLATEVQQKRSVRARTSTKTNNEPRLCGNGKPMPSLAELEAMYEDSDEDENPTPKTTPQSPQTVPLPTERCETPEQKPLLTENININSPETLKKLTSKVIDIISKTIVLDDDDDAGNAPRPPVIPQKKPKKSDIPYIVGCKDRPQVPWASKAKIGVDRTKYGIDPNQPPDDEDEKKKRKKRGDTVNLSKSIFNAKSDEIAERLKELDTISNVAPGSPDSTSTVDYDYNSAVRIPRNFSPLPSTSNDTDVILENDRLFNKSLMSEYEHLPKKNSPQASPIIPPASPESQQGSPGEVEIIDIPYETVVIDDTFPDINLKGQKRKSTDLDDDCCIILDSEIKRKRNKIKAESPPKDDIYGSIDLTQTYDNEVYEINDEDIDDLIAENKAVLEKNRNKSSIDCVTFVDPNVIVIESENKLQQSESTSSSQLNVPTPSLSLPSTSSSNVMPVVSHPPPPAEVERVEVTKTSVNNTTASGQPSKSIDISEVVNNFFNQSSNNNSSSRISNESKGTSTIDLTSSQVTMMNRISSWIFSLESYLSGRNNNRNRRNNSDQVVVVDDVQRTIPNSNEPEHLATPLLIHFGTTRTPSSTNQHSESSSQNKVTAPNPQPTEPIATQPSPGLTSQQSPPQRSLGDCPICMDNLSNNAVASTICGHVFCMACIKAAIRANGKKCPTCRKSLKGVGYHQLFL